MALTRELPILLADHGSFNVLMVCYARCILTKQFRLRPRSPSNSLLLQGKHIETMPHNTLSTRIDPGLRMPLSRCLSPTDIHMPVWLCSHQDQHTLVPTPHDMPPHMAQHATHMLNSRFASTLMKRGSSWRYLEVPADLL